MASIGAVLSSFPFMLQPAEMSIEEIEEKVGSLIQADTISQLKSAVWKERLEGISILETSFAFLNSTLKSACVYTIQSFRVWEKFLYTDNKIAPSSSLCNIP